MPPSDPPLPSPGQSRKQIEEAIKNYEVNSETIEMGLGKQAEITFTYFKKLVEAGFSETQAMEIIKARGVG